MSVLQEKELPKTAALKWLPPQKPQDRRLQLSLCPFSEFVSFIQRLGIRKSIFPENEHSPEHYQTLLKDPVMAKVKNDYNYNNFSMEPDSILFLKDVIEHYKPQTILELGSGISTPILSAHQKKHVAATSSAPRYVTIDQSDAYLTETMAMVEKAGTSDIVKPLIFPLCNYTLEKPFWGQSQLVSYGFDENALHEALGGQMPDMIIIDGPTGGKEGGNLFTRMLTVPILKLYSGAETLFFLDDSYRDTEILSMIEWHTQGYLNVIGVKMVGKGTMVAQNKV